MKFVFVLLSIFVIAMAISMRSAAAAETAAEADVCHLERDTGPCRQAELSFYHDSEKKQCEQFFYGGCMGNGNRFETKEECEKRCVKK